jgi:hypothetical protein
LLAIRANDLSKHIPVLLYTSDVEGANEKMDTIAGLGDVHVLMKGGEPNMLLHRVKQIVDREPEAV